MMSLSGTNVIVTGGAGFIGSELCRQLAVAGGIVRVVDNLVNGKRSNLELLPPGSFTFYERDIREANSLKDLLSRDTIVYHLACLGVRHSLHSPRENHDVNASATLNLLSQARAADVRRFVYCSSSEVYGSALHVPMTENHPTNPTTVYGASKLAGECYARAYFSSYALPTVVLRPFNTYGPRCHHEGDSGEVIPKFLLRSLAGKSCIIFGDGNQTRDFTYVSDTAKGLLEAGIRDGIVGETINLGYKHEISINELAREIAHVAGRKEALVEYFASRPGDTRRLYSENERARRLLGYEPTVSLREGLMRLRDWYLSLSRSFDELLSEDSVFNWQAADPGKDDA